MQTQVKKLIAIRAIRSFLITMPIIVIYWQSFGLTIQDIFWLQVIFSIAIIVLEIPSGYFADVFGKKLSLVLGTILGAAGFLMYFLAGGFIGFVIAEIILAISISLISGANEALLYQTLKAAGNEQSYPRYQGRLLAVGTGSEAVAAILTGVIAYYSSLEMVMFLQFVVLLPAILIAISLDEEYENVNWKTPTLLVILQGSLKHNPRLRALNLYSGAVSASTLTMVWLVQPHWSTLGMNIIYFGYLWAALNLTVAVGAHFAHQIERAFRFRTIFAGIAIMPAVLYGLMAAFSTSYIALMVVPLFWLLRGVQTPIVQDYVQREASDADRATTMSINNLSSRLIFSIFSPMIGWSADVWSFEAAFAASALIFGTLSLTGFVLLYSAMRAKTV